MTESTNENVSADISGSISRLAKAREWLESMIPPRYKFVTGSTCTCANGDIGCHARFWNEEPNSGYPRASLHRLVDAMNVWNARNSDVRLSLIRSYSVTYHCFHGSKMRFFADVAIMDAVMSEMVTFRV